MRTLSNFLLVITIMLSFQGTSNARPGSQVPALPPQPLTLTGPGGDFSISIRADTGTSFILEVINPACEKLSLQLIHASLGIVIERQLSDSIFKCRYNLSSAADGQYRIVVSNGKKKIRKKILLNTLLVESRQIDLAQ